MITPKTIAVIGLGYVGLPLAIEFAKKYHTIGFDINPKRIKEIKEAIDSTLEVPSEDLSRLLSSNLVDLNVWMFQMLMCLLLQSQLQQIKTIDLF
jgi:UDP-N-acetyl-D-mannosaminuronate dehydrogenase